MTARSVVVIGGGLAGITAAITLREAGLDVTLLEARPRLGGATSSFSRGGLMIDTGQHVFLRCCTSYRELLARLGMTGSVALQDRFDVTVLSPGGQARLRRNALPAPLHLGSTLVAYRFLSLPERLRVARAALAMRFTDPAAPGLDRQRLGDWLSARGQNERARRSLWDLFIVSSLNIEGDEASASLAATVLKTALLSSNGAADIGVPTVPLGELHGEAGGRLLGRLGAQVRLATKAAAVERDPAGGFLVRLTSGGEAAPDPDEAAPAGVGSAPAGAAAGVGSAPAGTGSTAVTDSGGIHADGVILAVPAAQAARLAGAAGAAGAAQWSELGTSPIVNVHVVYDRRVTRLPFAAALDSPVQWVFDKTRTSGLPTGQYLAISLSAADSYVDVPTATLRERFLPALEQLFPEAADAHVTDFFVTRERRATFRQAPGSGALRPAAVTSLPGLVLAGAWTDTGWPDTMEGAVRSGRTAAQELIHALAAQTAGEPAPGGARPAALADGLSARAAGSVGQS
jgi:squalene-associated FAD-dependent desaturase